MSPREARAQWDGMGGWGNPPREEMKPKITGYRNLSDAEISLINRVKAKAGEVGELVAEIQKGAIAWLGPDGPPQGDITIDPRWLAIGRTDLQQGFMSVIRAIARPEGF